ncbi:hypothetical protein BKA62DRAFT_826011 [Auriculariales sp. MPI-PUGE-AT-0066]|nr:hypothetical protein BKA62DRAFT_826011 [Auriculariales sp. MPI-PUGE-AT-0066]
MPVFKCPVDHCTTTTTRSTDMKRHLNCKHLKCEYFQCPFCVQNFWQKDGAFQHACICQNRGRSAVPNELRKIYDARSPLLKRWKPGMSLPRLATDGSNNAEMLNAAGNVWQCDAVSFAVRLRGPAVSPREAHQAQQLAHKPVHAASQLASITTPPQVPVAASSQSPACNSCNSASSSVLSPNFQPSDATPTTNCESAITCSGIPIFKISSTPVDIVWPETLQAPVDVFLDSFSVPCQGLQTDDPTVGFDSNCDWAAFDDIGQESYRLARANSVRGPH